MHSKGTSMNKVLKITSLSLTTAILLQGCGSGGGGKYEASSNTVVASNQSSFVQKDGLSGTVLSSTYIVGADVCFDINSNGLCDSNEPSEKTYANGKFSFSSYNTNLGKDANLVVNINDEYVLTATQKSSNQVISPFTTITNNEILFNPYSNAKESDAVNDLLSESTIFNKSYLEGEDYLQSNQNIVNIDANNIVNSLKTSYDLDKTKPLDTIATTVDEVLKNKNFSVTVSSIPTQKRYDSSYSLELDTKTLDIDTQDGNQRAVGVKASSNRTVVHSKWNNRLTIIDSSNQNKIATKNYLDGANGDTQSGPSEKILSKMIITDNNSNVYSLTKKDKVSNTNDGLGIYNSTFSASGIPTLKYASLSVGNNNYYAHNSFTDFSLSNDKSKIIASSDLNKIFVFNSSDFSSSLLELNVSSSVKAVAYSSDDNHFFASFNNSINVYNANTNTFVSSFLLNKEIKQIVSVSATEILVSFSNSNEVNLLDISNLNALSVKRVFIADSIVNKFDLSSDKKSFAVTLNNSKVVNSFLLSDNSVVAKTTLLNNVNDFVFTTDSKLMALTDFKAYYLNLKGDGLAPTTAQKQTWRTSHRR